MHACLQYNTGKVKYFGKLYAESLEKKFGVQIFHVFYGKQMLNKLEFNKQDGG
jgi:hypothetical protein